MARRNTPVFGARVAALLLVGLGSAPAYAVGSGNNLIPDIPTGGLTVRLASLTTVPYRVTDITNAGDGSGRLFIVTPDGVVRVYKNGALLPTPFLSLPAWPSDIAMSSVAFHPDHEHNRKLYVVTGETRPNPFTPDYSSPQNDTSWAFDDVLVEFRTSVANPDVVDMSTRRDLLRVHQVDGIHNINDLTFGRDGYLYVSMGDGGDTRTGTPTHYEINAQQTTNPFGKILRIDVDQIGPNGRYAIPPDNPFAGGAGGNVPEIFAWGLRNPWRLSTDLLTGELYTAVNGDYTIEQIYRVQLGQNYAWAVREGSFRWNPATGAATVDPNPDPQFTNPLAQYDHNNTTEAFGSVVGGFVYRGSRLPQLYGKYLSVDWKAGRLIAMHPGTGALELVQIDPAGRPLVPNMENTWGEGEDGELYIGRNSGEVLSFVYTSSADFAGTVPDGTVAPQVPLRIARASGADITLTWNGSCVSGDDDYEIYEGVLGDFDSHKPSRCSTAGATSATVSPAPGSRYYLVVPASVFREGSYGTDGAGNERPPGAVQCLVQAIGSCP